MKVMTIPVLTALVLSVDFAYGQENNAPQEIAAEPQATITDTTPSQVAPSVDDSPFRRLEAMLWLARHGIRSEGGFGLPPSTVPSSANAPFLQADVIRLDLSLKTVEATGNVIVTTTQEDGSTVTMSADRMTIEEGP